MPTPTRTPTTGELRQLVRSRPRTPGRVEAFAELVARDPKDLDRTLSDLALDRRLDTSMRTKAVVALGRHATPVALRALRRAIVTDDALVLQRAIERLGKVGDRSDLERLRDIRTCNHITLRVLRTAKVFLSYRHRLDEYRVDHGLGSDPARRTLCGSRELALMVNEAIVAEAPESLVTHQAVLAVIVIFNDETSAYEPAYWLLSDPARGGRFRIVGVRPSGRVGLAGSGTVEDGRVTFELNAIEAPLDHPMTIAGRYDQRAGRVRVDHSLVTAREG